LCWFDEVDVKKAEMGNALGVLITGEQINVERKGINGILENPNTLKCVLTANSLPLSSEHGMYRRIIIINLEGSFHDEGTVILNMSELLRAESSGILNRMIKGLHDLRKMRGFTVIEGHEDLIEEYKTDSNITSEFLDTYFEPTTNTETKIKTGELYKAFVRFTGGKTNAISSPQRFAMTMKTQPLSRFGQMTQYRSNGVRYWKGIKLRDNLEMDVWGEITDTGYDNTGHLSNNDAE